VEGLVVGEVFETCPPSRLGEQGTLVEVEHPRPELARDPARPALKNSGSRPPRASESAFHPVQYRQAGPSPHRHRYAVARRPVLPFGATPGSGFPAGLRDRQSLGGRFRPVTTCSSIRPDHASILRRFGHGMRVAVREVATGGCRHDGDCARQTAGEFDPPPGGSRRCRGHAPTREAPDARRAGRCRQRLPEVRNGVERAWKGLFADADAWFRSSAADRPLDFESICQALGLAPSFIRVGLHRWCSARRREPRQSRTVLRFPFRRMSGTRHMISAVS